jgi:phosphoenolpyruvate synthase/pyruvate phosphate dikinase
MKEQLHVIDVLSRDFNALWIIEDKKGTCRLFRGQNSSLEEYGQAGLPLSGGFITFMQAYIKGFVAEKDQEKIQEILFDKYFFELIPQDGRPLTLNYEKIWKGETHYFQMSFARFLRTGDDSSYVILGFRNIDTIIGKEKKQQELLSVVKEQAEAIEKAKKVFLASMKQES